MNPPRVVKAASPAAFLRMVPDLAGLEPVESLVLVAFGGKRTIGALRIDLPVEADDLDLQRWAVTAVGMICKVDAVTGVIPIAYSSRQFATTGRPPYATLLRAVRRQAQRSGLDVKDLFSVAADAWGSLLDPTLPRGGRPLAEIAVEGPRRARPAGTLPAVPAADEAAQQRFRARMRQWDTRSNGPGGTVHGIDLGSPQRAFGRAAHRETAVIRMLLRGGFGTVAEGMLEPHADDDCTCLPLLALFAEWTVVQQALLLQFGWGAELADELLGTILEDRMLEADHPAALALWGGAVRRPDVDRLRRASAVVLSAAGHLPEGERGPLLAMAAWLHWAQGSGTVAGGLAELALAAAPGERLATTLHSMIGSAVLPEWAFSADPGRDPLRSLA